MKAKKPAVPTKKATTAPLVRKNKPEEVVAWQCTSCGSIYQTEYAAETCSVQKNCSQWTCEECGQPAFSAYQWYCLDCLRKHRKDRELEKLEHAEYVIKASDYPPNQPVVFDDEYYESIEDLLESFEEEEKQIPKRVWATSSQILQISAEDVLEHAVDEWVSGYEGINLEDIPGKKEFEDAVAIFNKQQTMSLFFESGNVVELADENSPEEDD